MAEPLLSIRGLKVAYGGIQAVKGIDLDVHAGELVALIGANGAGKTTTMKAITGALPWAAGDVRYDGASLAGVGSHALVGRGLAMVPEGRGVFARMTITENLLMGAYSRSDRAAIAEDVEKMFGLFPRLRERATQLAGTMSGGEQQMLAMARALMGRPRLLLLDEPFGALDAQVRVDLRRWLREVHDQTGHTTLFVTHDQEEALELADRVAVFRNGRIEQVGTPDEVYRSPRTPFVFDFIGRGGRLAGRIDDGGLRLPGIDVLVPVSGPALAGEARLLLRPGELAIAAPGDGVPAEVRAARRIGDRLTVDVAVPGQEGLIEVDLPAGERLPHRGERVGLRVLGGTVLPARVAAG